MNPEPEDNMDTPNPPGAGAFRWGRFAFWMPVCLVHGAAVAWVAMNVEPYWAPVLVFPLLVGIVLGATLVAMTRLGQVGNRRTILVGTVLAVLATVVGQHYISYRIVAREIEEDAKDYQLARQAFGDQVLESPVPPPGFVGFLRWDAARGFDVFGRRVHGTVVWLIWTADGLLVLAAALGLVVLAIQRPYCDRCRSWVGTTRLGRIDATTARRLAALLGIELPEGATSARYWLFSCHGGCGPTGFALRWEEPGAAAGASHLWLDTEPLGAVVQTLDAATAHP